MPGDYDGPGMRGRLFPRSRCLLLFLPSVFPFRCSSSMALSFSGVLCPSVVLIVSSRGEEQQNRKALSILPVLPSFRSSRSPFRPGMYYLYPDCTLSYLALILTFSGSGSRFVYSGILIVYCLSWHPVFAMCVLAPFCIMLYTVVVLYIAISGSRSIHPLLRSGLALFMFNLVYHF